MILKKSKIKIPYIRLDFRIVRQSDVRCCERTAVSHRLLLDLYLYVEQFVHVGLPFVHRGIEKIKYSVILSTYHGKQIKLSVIVRQLRRGGGENDGQ